MTLPFPSAASDFLQNYSRDAAFRWSAEDLVAQQQFVNAQVARKQWRDWSTESAAFQLMQASFAGTSLAESNRYEAIVLAGPIVELLQPDELFSSATAFLNPGGTIVAIMPCLRDNSPESQLFAQIAASTLWPYHTAEELLELVREAGVKPDARLTRFVSIPRFNEAVRKDQFAFKGFRRVFEELEAQGYDATEVGWGEVRLVATPRDDSDGPRDEANAVGNDFGKGNLENER